MNTLHAVTDGPALRTPEHRSTPLWDAPERLSYEAVILAHNPRLALLLDGTLEGEVRR